jgi:serine/threonine protein kinase
MLCPSCGGELSSSHRFCPSCGAPISSFSQAPTAEAESPVAPAAAVVAPVGRLISSDSLPVGGFTPGMVLAGRYRIIGLLGRGGMGEVYRADDLKLGQPVALKFLPKALADDPVKRERLFAEVRIARQVSHPNICRVYDISEFEGRHFLTMEYIDGEDLASLLKRIGSLHGAKAVDVAQQLCAGLAAAHDKGVLHRDLKPANVMIDGRGRVRITDFGLAVATGEEISATDVSGTPPYMAPEQFAGKGASVRSDIYALGLVFYEIFTGKRAFEARTLAELRAKKEASSPTAPSEVVRDIDQIIERVILRCIEKDPRQRPASVAQVAAALPGGDPLAAALAAGETPSPEMVAASGSVEGLKPWIAWTCLALIILGIIGSEFLSRQARLFQRVPVTKQPQALAQIAQDILKNAGWTESAVDSVFGFYVNNRYFQNVEKKDKSSHRYENLPSHAILFWYRQSPRPIVHSFPFTWNSSNKGVSLSDPPLGEGEAVVWLDSRGNLVGLKAIPSERHQHGAAQMTDWAALFKASGIDQAKFTPVPSSSRSPAYWDRQEAWTGMLPDYSGSSIRIEAASFEGKPVSWRIISPEWDGPSVSDQPLKGIPPLNVLIISLLVIGAALLARRNLRMGRGDKRGAARIAWIIFALYTTEWIFGEHHLLNTDPSQFLLSASLWVAEAGFIWLMYVALEPFVRRRWAGWIVGWNRLLAGNFRDPLVGRDLLVGCVGGVLFMLLTYLYYPIFSLLNLTQPRPDWQGAVNTTLHFFSGPQAIASGISFFLRQGLTMSLFFTFLAFLLLVPFKSKWRNRWVATAVVFITIIAVSFREPGADTSAALGIYILVTTFVWFSLLFRFGLLVFLAQLLVLFIMNNFPITFQPAWYAGIGFTGLALLLAFALYAFHTSLGGQPLFGRASLED